MSHRYAAAQFEVGTDGAANLETCLRMIDEAAKQKPDVLVLPEFCNYLTWYRDHDEAWREAVDLDGPFLAAIAGRAARHRMFIKVNCTVRRGRFRGQDQAITSTNVLLDDHGRRIADGDKQILMGAENLHMVPGDCITPVIDTPHGRLGMYCCMDGVIPEITRSLALRGAQVLLNSLNSFALDEAGLHIPVRAPENGVFVVAANKVGGLVPADQREAVAARVKIAPSFLEGAGESQIIAPDGRVLVRGPRTGAAIVCADIEPSAADNKRGSDGVDLFASRRPALYAAMARAGALNAPPAAERVQAAAVAGEFSASNAALDEVRRLSTAGARLIALPAGTVEAGRLGDLAAACGRALVATSVMEGGQRVAVLVGAQGAVLRQPQLHDTAESAGIAATHDPIATFDADFGRLALVNGADARYLETFRLLPLLGVNTVAVVADRLEAWFEDLGARERAAENRLNLVIAPRRGPAQIVAANPDFTLWTEWKNRPFDGSISAPLVTRGERVAEAPIFPAASANRQISHRTDLIANRPTGELVKAIVA